MPKVDPDEWAYNARHDTLLYVVGVLATINDTLIEMRDVLTQLAGPDEYIIKEPTLMPEEIRRLRALLSGDWTPWG